MISMESFQVSESAAGVPLAQPEGPEGAWDGIGSSLPQPLVTGPWNTGWEHPGGALPAGQTLVPAAAADLL